MDEIAGLPSNGTPSILWHNCGTSTLIIMCLDRSREYLPGKTSLSLNPDSKTNVAIVGSSVQISKSFSSL